MWKPLSNPVLIHEEGLLRKIIYEDNFKHETRFKIIRVRNSFFMAQQISYDNTPCKDEQQIIDIYSINHIHNLDFQIWIEE